MNKQNIRLDLITIDAGTQQRDIDKVVVSDYLSLMADGVEFPPVEVVSDGPNFWLWDGFHRVECANRGSRKTIPAFVTEGKLRDAIWLSFGANKAHGLPRQKGIARKIIEAILTDTSWSKKSLTALARHVGVTREYISRTKAELEAHGVNRSHHAAEQNGDSELKTTAHGVSTYTIDEAKPSLQRAEEIEVERGGRTYKQKSQEKEHKPAESPKDAVGRAVPEPLRELYEGREIIQGFVSDLARLRDGVVKHLDVRDLAFFLLNTTAFQANYENLRRTLKSAMPYAVCPYCGGEDSKKCRACQGFGLLNKDSYEAVPKDLKI